MKFPECEARLAGYFLARRLVSITSGISGFWQDTIKAYRAVSAPAKKPEDHIVTVDATRGVLAVSVMIYHLLYANQIVQIERIAFFAVYGFFVISGFALYVTYSRRISDLDDIRSYFIKRVFRIAPLYLTVLAARIAVHPLPEDFFYRFLLNVTLTFGFANPGTTSLNGGGGLSGSKWCSIFSSR